MDNDARKVAGAFLIGGLIGAGIALLYAPQSGCETRKDISKAAKRIRKDAVELVEDTIEHAQDFADDVKDRATEIIERGIELSDKAKREIVKSFEHSQKMIEKQTKRIVEGLGL